MSQSFKGDNYIFNNYTII